MITASRFFFFLAGWHEISKNRAYSSNIMLPYFQPPASAWEEQARPTDCCNKAAPDLLRVAVGREGFDCRAEYLTVTSVQEKAVSHADELFCFLLCAVNTY